jgi:hypothetical protein
MPELSILNTKGVIGKRPEVEEPRLRDWLFKAFVNGWYLGL